MNNKNQLKEVPHFQSFFYPFLDFASDQKEHSLNEVRDYLTIIPPISRTVFL
mgnify:CR=1 FL=1